MRYFQTHCTYTETFENGQHYYIFTGPCMGTGKQYSVKVPGPELYEYNQGAYIQDAMKSVSPGDRDFLLSGFSPEYWKLHPMRDEE